MYVMGDNSVFKQASNAKEQSEISQWQEKLEMAKSSIIIERLGIVDPDAYFSYIQEQNYINNKETDVINNQDGTYYVTVKPGYLFLVTLMPTKENPTDIKIEYLGKREELVFPTVNATFTLDESDNKSATITATALETKDGIKRVEIWFEGEKIKEYPYSNVKTEVTIEPAYEVYRNGTYTVKVCGKLSTSTTVKVEGIVPTVTFSLNESKEWKKEHTTQVILEKTSETVTEMKYVWVKDDKVNKPTEFTGDCLNNRTVTGGSDTMTGTYYLWVMVKTARETSYSTSGAFYFDNDKPTVELTSTPVSETSFTLTATASDNHSKIANFKFYIDNNEYEPQNVTEEGVATYTWNGTQMRKNVQANVVVFDSAGNTNKDDINDARTTLHTWKMFDVKTETKYREKNKNEVYEKTYPSTWSYSFEKVGTSKVFDVGTGKFTITGNVISTTILSSSDISGNSAAKHYYSPDNGINAYYLSSFIKKWNKDGVNGAQWNAIHYYSEMYEDKSAGNVYKGTIMEDSEDVYPKNNNEGDIWYYYIGIT